MAPIAPPASPNGLWQTRLAMQAAQTTPTFQPIHTGSRDGTSLYGELHPAARPVGGALIIHGYAEHAGRYREVAAHLVDAGLTALALDLRGHGRSGGPRGSIRRFTDYLDDVEAGLGALDPHLGADAEILLVCHSNGALAGLRLLADPFRCPPRIRAAVLSSPYLALRTPVSAAKRALGTVASRLLPSLAVPHDIDPAILTHDPDKLRDRQVDTLCHDVASARWYTEAQATQAWVREFAHRIATPTLWLVAGADELVDAAATREVHQRIEAPSEYVEYEGMYHEVFNEVERARVLTRLRDFAREHFPGLTNT